MASFLGVIETRKGLDTKHTPMSALLFYYINIKRKKGRKK
jgi:hypothetical protein